MDERMHSMEQGRHLYQIAIALLLPTNLGMVIFGALGGFQLGSDDYAQWQAHRWAPMFCLGLVAFALGLVALPFTRARRSALGLAVSALLGIASLCCAAAGIVVWNHRTNLKSSLSAALDDIDLGSTFTVTTTSFNVVRVGSGPNAPNAVRYWSVDSAPDVACRRAAAAVGEWAGSVRPLITFAPTGGCRFQVFYKTFRATFLITGPAPSSGSRLQALLEATK
jgi:hypothetical protein